MTYGPTLFAQAAASMGYHPFPHPAGNLSQPYTNPLGRQLGAMHLLRLLREVRLRQLFQGHAADHDPALPDDQAELRAAHRVPRC